MESRREKIGAIAVTIVAVPLLIITNPKRSAYVSYFSKKVINETAEVICQEHKSCRRGIQDWKEGTVPRQALNVAINLATKRQNFIFFSIYTTSIPGTYFKFTTIGVLGNFIHLSEG